MTNTERMKMLAIQKTDQRLANTVQFYTNTERNDPQTINNVKEIMKSNNGIQLLNNLNAEEQNKTMTVIMELARLGFANTLISRASKTELEP